MNAGRRARGFERLGVAGARALGLPPSRRKSLEIEAAWRRVAGSSIARRALVVSLDRGELTLAVAAPEWRRAIERLLPELTDGLAKRHPSLGVSRVRLVDAPSR